MSALPCPACGNTTTTVVNSRLHRSYYANTVRRQRVCAGCDEHFETIEQLFTRPSTSKLSPSDAGAIRRQMSLGGTTQAELARKYKVSPRTIWMIVHNYRWTKPERKSQEGATE